MKNTLKTFGPNLLGRDFVIGDLHGALPCFRNLCAEIYFDPTKDRMFSVGDLVDRGPQSLECLELLRELWFHAVLANHEQLMLEAFTGGYMGQFWFQNGGRWGFEALQTWKALNKTEGEPVVVSDEDANLFDLVNNIVSELPFLITINHISGKKFHILHAELPPTYVGVTDERLSDPDEVLKLAVTQVRDGDAFLWARYIFMPFYCQSVTHADAEKEVTRRNLDRFFSDELSHIISGHTIVTHPITLIGQTNIDTCAYGACGVDPDGWNALTCIELDTWTFYQATPNTFKVVEPITVNKSDLTQISNERHSSYSSFS